MSYKVTIIDNETKKVRFDGEVSCFVGALRNDEHTAQFSYCHCDSLGVAQTVVVAERAIRSTLENMPLEVRVAKALLDQHPEALEVAEREKK